MAQRATSLGPKPSLFFCFLFIFAVLSLPLIENPVFPLKRPFLLFIFCVSLCFSLAFFGLPFFHFLVFVSLSLSLSCYFLYSLLPVSHVNFWFLLFVIGLFVFVSRCSNVFVSFLSCVVLNPNLRFIFVLHLICCCCYFCFSFCCFHIFCFFDVWLPLKSISENMEIQKTAKMQNAEKKRTF